MKRFIRDSGQGTFMGRLLSVRKSYRRTPFFAHGFLVALIECEQKESTTQATFMTDDFSRPSELSELSPRLRRKYFALKEKSFNIETRDEALEEIRELFIHEAGYEFDPETFMADRLIPKGQILKAIRDGCIHE